MPSATPASTTRSVRRSWRQSASWAAWVRSIADSTTSPAVSSVPGRPASELLRQQVAEQHHPLRVPAREGGELAERLARVQALVLEAPAELVEHLLDRQRPERERIRLAEQRPLALVEELPHHRGLRAGVDVRRGVAVVLDPRAHQPVEVGARGQRGPGTRRGRPGSRRRRRRAASSGGPAAGRAATRPPRRPAPTDAGRSSRSPPRCRRSARAGRAGHPGARASSPCRAGRTPRRASAPRP